MRGDQTRHFRLRYGTSAKSPILDNGLYTPYIPHICQNQCNKYEVLYTIMHCIISLRQLRNVQNVDRVSQFGQLRHALAVGKMIGVIRNDRKSGSICENLYHLISLRQL